VHRFFAPSLDPGDETVDLPRDEAEHLTRVLRLGVGDTVSVFNGRGQEFLGRIVSAARRDARVQLLSMAAGTPKPMSGAQALAAKDGFGDAQVAWFSFQLLYEEITKEQPDLLEE